MNDTTSKFGKILKQVQDDVSSERFSRKKAFTLAEVLITLGIIGVIAALTIPTLIQKIDDKIYISMWKKKYSEIAIIYEIVKNEIGNDSVCVINDGNYN